MPRLVETIIAKSLSRYPHLSLVTTTTVQIPAVATEDHHDLGPDRVRYFNATHYQ
jgi:hypothetical protein